VRKIFILPDPHFGPPDAKGNGGHDEGAVATALKAVEIERPDEIIILGDIGEWASCSPWEFKRRAYPPLQITLDNLNIDIEYVQDGLDRICDAARNAGCRKITLLEGNHEIWVSEMVKQTKLIAEHYYLPRVLDLEKRGIEWHEYGKYIERGQLLLYHGGHYATIHHAYNHAVKLGSSCGYGHTHDIQYVTVPSARGPHGGYSFGCLCRLQKGFLKGRKTNWQHAFGMLYIREGTDPDSMEDFKVDIHRIEKGWTVLHGQQIVNGKLLGGRPRKDES